MLPRALAAARLLASNARRPLGLLPGRLVGERDEVGTDISPLLPPRAVSFSRFTQSVQRHRRCAELAASRCTLGRRYPETAMGTRSYPHVVGRLSRDTMGPDTHPAGPLAKATAAPSGAAMAGGQRTARRQAHYRRGRWGQAGPPSTWLAACRHLGSCFRPPVLVRFIGAPSLTYSWTARRLLNRSPYGPRREALTASCSRPALSKTP
jgi:hypothetical protein